MRPSSRSLHRRIVHEFAQFLRAAARDRDLPRPLHGFGARRHLKHGEAAVQPAARIDLGRHRPVAGNQHRIDLLLDPATEDIDASRLGLVNYRVRSNYYIVDRLFAAAELRLGTSPQQVVRISRTDVARSNDVKR